MKRSLSPKKGVFSYAEWRCFFLSFFFRHKGARKRKRSGRERAKTRRKTHRPRQQSGGAGRLEALAHSSLLLFARGAVGDGRSCCFRAAC